MPDDGFGAKRVAISGCSSGGKSTLLAELSSRGYATVEEPGRRIVAAEQAAGGDALPWRNMEAFLRKALELSLRDIDEALQMSGWVFFDRGLIDAAAGLAELTGQSLKRLVDGAPGYHHRVFLAPPWPEIYVTDAQRPHLMAVAMEEYRRLLRAFPLLGYEVVVLPKASVACRADFVLRNLGESGD